MTTAPSAESAWADRAAARSPTVQRSRDRSIQQATQIVDAAIELIGEKGSAFTIHELAKRARVALQTFYRHFAGKDELLLAAIEQIITEAMAGFQALVEQEPDPLTRLRRYFEVTVGTLNDPDQAISRRFITAEHYRLHQLFPDELTDASKAFTERLVPEIQAAAELGLLAPHDVEADAWFVTELVMATFHHYAYASHSGPADELVENLWQFCLRGLGGKPAARSFAVPRPTR